MVPKNINTIKSAQILDHDQPTHKTSKTVSTGSIRLRVIKQLPRSPQRPLFGTLGPLNPRDHLYGAISNLIIFTKF